MPPQTDGSNPRSTGSCRIAHLLQREHVGATDGFDPLEVQRRAVGEAAVVRSRTEQSVQDVEIGDGHVGIGTRRGPRGAARLEAARAVGVRDPTEGGTPALPAHAQRGRDRKSLGGRQIARPCSAVGRHDETPRTQQHAPDARRHATGIVVAPAAAGAVTVDRTPARGRKPGEDEALARGGAAVQHERRAVDARIGQRDGDRRVLHLQRRAAAVRIPVTGAQPQQLPAHREVGCGESRHGNPQHEEQRRDSRSSAMHVRSVKDEDDGGRQARRRRPPIVRSRLPGPDSNQRPIG